MGEQLECCYMCGVRMKEEYSDAMNHTRWGLCERCKEKEEKRLLMETRRARYLRQGRKKVYVCAPFKGDEERNAERARKIARRIVDIHLERGEEAPVVFVPHISFTYMDEGTERDQILEMCVEMVLECDEIVVYGEDVTEGMKKEIEAAYKMGVEVKYMDEGMEKLMGRKKNEEECECVDCCNADDCCNVDIDCECGVGEDLGCEAGMGRESGE